MVRIVFAGAQGTGKTTVAKWLSEHSDLTLVTDIARNSPFNNRLNKTTNHLNQLYIMSAIGAHSMQEQTISDRSPFDAMAYLNWSFCHEQLDDEDLPFKVSDYWYQLDIAKRLMNNYSHIVYFPAYDWSDIDDGVRDTDSSYRKDIDTIIEGYLRIYATNKYLTMPDTSAESRVEMLKWMLEVNGVSFK